MLCLYVCVGNTCSNSRVGEHHGGHILVVSLCSRLIVIEAVCICMYVRMKL